MDMTQARVCPHRVWALVIVLVAGMLAGLGSQPAAADVSAVKGSACGYITDVSLFGGAKMLRGCGQTENAPAGNSPSVTLPATGSAQPVTAADADGATAQYGPAKIFSGQYPNKANDPEEDDTSPPSGPLRVSTQGTTGPSGSVMSSAAVDPGTQGTADPNQPRGVGPGPIIANAVSSSCTASESGVSATTTITGGRLETKYDSTSQLATVTEDVPTNPPVNYTKTGTIDHVGDSFRVVYNEQTTAADGTITVNAVHMYLLGPTAVGDLIIAQSVCGVTVTAATTTTTAAGATTTTAAGATTTTTAAGATTTTAAGATTTTAGGVTTTTSAGAGAGTTTTQAATATTAAVAAAAASQSTTTTAPPGEVSGGACGYYTDVSLFGGPKNLRGCGQPSSAPADNGSPSVTLPAGGSATPITASDPDGATAVYGPAKIFSGQYPNKANDPDDDDTSPPSGPLRVSTQGTPGGTVTSTANVDPGTQGTAEPNQPRGVGPGPIIADAVSSTCSASASGVTASVTITNGKLETKYDVGTQLAVASEDVPTNPPVNYTKTGTIDHVGDAFRVVYNEQIVGADGSITVNAVHMSLLGPTAIGDLVIAQSRCARTAGGTSGGGGVTAAGVGATATGGRGLSATGTNALRLVAVALLLVAAGGHLRHWAPSGAGRPSGVRTRRLPWD